MDLKIFIPASPPLPFFLLVAMVHVARIVAVDHISSNHDAVAGDHPDVAGTTMEFFMHDIPGGSSPTGRPITGLLGSIYSSQVPFARPIGLTTPRGGVPIPNANGDIPTINGNNRIPLGTGLSGTTFSQPTNGPAPNVQRQLGPDGLGLGFGKITVIDDLLKVGPDVGSQTIGKAQGVYLASLADGTMMAFTAMIGVWGQPKLLWCVQDRKCHVPFISDRRNWEI